jgi:Pentapeptide repeats (8 copies)
MASDMLVDLTLSPHHASRSDASGAQPAQFPRDLDADRRSRARTLAGLQRPAPSKTRTRWASASRLLAHLTLVGRRVRWSQLTRCERLRVACSPGARQHCVRDRLIRLLVPDSLEGLLAEESPVRRVARVVIGKAAAKGVRVAVSKRFRRFVAVAGAGAVLAIFIALLVACVLFVPALIVDRRTGPAGPAAVPLVDRLNAENDVRSTLLQALGGLLALGGVAAGAAMTLRQIRVSREGHTIELFTKAIDQLSSDDISVRHGGVYALDFLAELDHRYAGKIHALLTAFIRQHAPWPPARPDAEIDAERARFHGGIADDVGGAISALRGGSMITEGAWSELENVDLRDAQLDGYNVPRTCFVGSNLAGARLVDADLRNASMSNTVLRSANLAGANLCGADLSAADLEGADLTGVTFDSETTWPPGFTLPTPNATTNTPDTATATALRGH